MILVGLPTQWPERSGLTRTGSVHLAPIYSPAHLPKECPTELKGDEKVNVVAMVAITVVGIVAIVAMYLQRRFRADVKGNRFSVEVDNDTDHEPPYV